MAGLYERHDRDKFEIIAIDSGGGDGSAMRRRLEAAFDKTLYIANLPDAEAVDLIRANEIDILVNLNGYFGAPRMGLFARRAAPIQINYLGFPATARRPLHRLSHSGQDCDPRKTSGAITTNRSSIYPAVIRQTTTSVLSRQKRPAAPPWACPAKRLYSATSTRVTR